MCDPRRQDRRIFGAESLACQASCWMDVSSYRNGEESRSRSPTERPETTPSILAATCRTPLPGQWFLLKRVLVNLKGERNGRNCSRAPSPGKALLYNLKCRMWFLRVSTVPQATRRCSPNASRSGKHAHSCLPAPPVVGNLKVAQYEAALPRGRACSGR